jgi:hypothetical protein
MPEVVGLPLDRKAATGFAISRLALHLRQYPSIHLEAPFSQKDVFMQWKLDIRPVSAGRRHL